MAEVNTIASFITPVPRPRAAVAERGAAATFSRQEQGATPDAYEPTGVGPGRERGVQASRACQCGLCPACAAQAYGVQDRAAGLPADESPAAARAAAGDQKGGRTEEEARADAHEPRGVDGEVLSNQEQARLAELKKRDQLVKAHEQAHVAAAGSLVRRGVSLSYEKGPDGRRYAVSGEVSIDTSREAQPEKTMAKMQTVRAAALAPVDPSPQDRKVAAAATAAMREAGNELRLERLGHLKDEEGGKEAAASPVELGAPSGDQGQANGIEPDRPQAHAARRYGQAAAAAPQRLTVNLLA
ncbi:MAG: hypothetical protein C0613_09655 [Desulfobulbaceae bacterium]|nr:MAG: hypothetical protein C0613_09655 [Desulfobulbaceae bacterium]